MIEKVIQKTYWYSDDGFEFSDFTIFYETLKILSCRRI